jgi:CheY-like chemotaxis protein
VSVLTGKRILVVEDESIVAAMVEDMLAELGASAVGPAGTIERALEIAETAAFDAAILDVNVRGELIDPVVRVLERRGVPFVFATGYGSVDRSPSPNAPILSKPYTQQNLERALTAALNAAAKS